MNCEQAQEQIAARWVAGLGEDARIELDEHLTGCAACRAQSESLTVLWDGLGDMPSEEPGRHMRAHFQQMLEAYRMGTENSSARRTEPANRTSVFAALGNLWPRHMVAQLVTAGIALVLGLAVGHLYTQRGQDQERIATLNSELSQMRELMTLSLLQQPSASERLRGVGYIEGIDAPDSRVTSALLDRLNQDTNVNVRLAAVDALRQFSSRTEVRRGMLQAMLKQDSPLVQLSLIEWAAESGDRNSIGALQSLRNSSGLNPAVETRLASALGRLQ